MRESMGGDFFQGGRGVTLNIIIMCGGWVEINFCLMRGGHDLVLGHISPISQPPLQVIIAQSLICHIIIKCVRHLEHFV